MNLTINLQSNKKIYFLSDLHLGLKPADKSREREKKVVQWLEMIKADAQVLFLLGDVFDYWFEHKKVAPQGFVRFLGKLSEVADSGIEIHLFSGNHDVWFFDYLPREIGLTVHHKPISLSVNGKKIYAGHGDGIGPGDWRYKLLKSIFRNKITQWMFTHLIHPDLNMRIGHLWSNHSRYSKGLKETFYGEEKECQIQFAKETLKKDFYDYFIFGHRHISYDRKLSDKTRIINLGEWITQSNYAVFDGKELQLKQF